MLNCFGSRCSGRYGPGGAEHPWIPARQAAGRAGRAAAPTGNRGEPRHLLDGVWGAEPPLSGSKVLASHINPLRRTLDPAGTPHTASVIRSGKGCTASSSTACGRSVGSVRARRQGAAHQGVRRPGHRCGRVVRSARSVPGEPLANLPGPFAQAERERLLERRRTIRLERLDCLILLGRFGDALDDLAVLSTFELYDESLLALRMRALYGCERQAEALNAYQDMRVAPA
ncbi:hypothetical protein E4K10_20615 [Streptomyces sp. T1317-0309]|nr:hypothetical protein E4K10_20615 [Streptomyces sp. T1317-0309]